MDRSLLAALLWTDGRAVHSVVATRCPLSTKRAGRSGARVQTDEERGLAPWGFHVEPWPASLKHGGLH